MRVIESYNRYILNKKHYNEINIQLSIVYDDLDKIREYIDNGYLINNRFIMDVKSKEMLLLLIRYGLTLDGYSYNIRDIIKTITKDEFNDLIENGFDYTFDNGYLKRENLI